MSGPNDSNEPFTSSNPPDKGDTESFFNDDNWTSVSKEWSKEKTGSKTPSPGAVKPVKNQKKFLRTTAQTKRRPTDLHSVSSAISAALDKKKLKTVNTVKVQSTLTSHFQAGTAVATTKAIPGTAVMSKKKTPPMSLTPKPPSPTTTTTIAKPSSPTNTNYDDNITKNLKKLTKNTTARRRTAQPTFQRSAQQPRQPQDRPQRVWKPRQVCSAAKMENRAARSVSVQRRTERKLLRWRQTAQPTFQRSAQQPRHLQEQSQRMWKSRQA
jgi:hypothetical protein